MNRRPPGADPAPWPFLGEDPPPGHRPSPNGSVPAAAGNGDTDAAGEADLLVLAAPRVVAKRIEIVPLDHDAAGDGLAESDRVMLLIQARDALAGALLLLDLNSRSPAAANVDLAIHHINLELSR